MPLFPNKEDEDDDAVEEDIAADENLFFFFSSSASISLLPQPACGVYLRARIFSANESPPAAEVFHAEAFNLNFFFPR